VKLARGVVALLGSAVAIGACTKSPRVETRAITLHAAAECAPGAAAFGLYDSFGDFQPPATPPSLPLANLGAELMGMPDDTREVVVDVTDVTEGQWRAHTLVPDTGDVDLLLLAYQSPCALTDTIDARTDAAVGAVDATHVLVAGGSAPNAVPTTVLVDLARGAVHTLSAGLLVPRIQATVTAWSGGAVVAGGARPDASGALQASAEVFVSSLGDFDDQLITLSEPRARHGAVVLANGETLLVGGVGANGAVLGSMEIVDAASHRAQTTKLASLSVPRADPQVMRLASGEILVAGGVDASGAAVSTLEWFKSDAGAASQVPQVLVASLHEAFVPLGAGGALAVVAPDVPAPGFQNVWVISAAGGLQAATPIDGTLSDVRIFDGTDQAPVLWTGDRWLVWQPWIGAFTALAPAIGTNGPTGDPTASPEPGLGVWVDGATVHALRFGARGPYVSATAPLLASDTSGTAPDRLADTGPNGAIAFDPTAGLSLESGASAFVTDATFASFTLDAETPGASPPAIVLRDAAGNETVLDSSACPTTPSATLHVERDGDTLRASTGGALVTCNAAPASGARVAIGVRGDGASASVVRAVVIVRE
jgi:hypothetical protein